MRLLPRPNGEHLLSWYGAGLTTLWPGLMVMTRRQWQGVEHLGRPGDGMVVAVNHLSWFDPFVVAHFLNDNGRSPRFMAKDSVFDVPIGGSILKGARQIPVYRESKDAAKAVSAAVAAVNAGESVVVYPEGTITRDPQLWPMRGRTGAARIALATRKPVIPVAQWGAQEVMAPYKIEANLFPPKTMRLRAGSPVPLQDLYDEEINERVLAIATDRIMDAITAQLVQIRGEEPPLGRWDPKTEQRVSSLTETEPGAAAE